MYITCKRLHSKTFIDCFDFKSIHKLTLSKCHIKLKGNKLFPLRWENIYFFHQICFMVHAKHFQSQISIAILPTVCHTILEMLFRRVYSGELNRQLSKSRHNILPLCSTFTHSPYSSPYIFKSAT